VRLTTSLPSCAEWYEIWEPKPPGTFWATPGLLRDSITLLSRNLFNDALLILYLERVSFFGIR